jgi:hypothetical protein
MVEKDARIFITSVNNASKKLEYYGDAKLEGIALLKLIYKYACYSTTYATLQRLNSMVATLQTTDPLICMERQAVASYSGGTGGDGGTGGTVEVGTESNQAPVLTPISFTLNDETYIFTFSYATLLSGYSDDEGGVASSFVINSLPGNGDLLYDGNAITTNTLLFDPSLLTYTRTGTSAYGTTFTFSAYDDDSQVPLVSNIVTATATIEEIVVSGNEPATVGDRAQYSGNRSTTVFTVADFTTSAIAPYFDPEGNDLDAILITEISDANTGVYYYFASPVAVGQVITNAELSAGAFYHIAPDANSIKQIINKCYTQ